jgi:hypothetical protein
MPFFSVPRFFRTGEEHFAPLSESVAYLPEKIVNMGRLKKFILDV